MHISHLGSRISILKSPIPNLRFRISHNIGLYILIFPDINPNASKPYGLPNLTTIFTQIPTTNKNTIAPNLPHHNDQSQLNL